MSEGVERLRLSAAALRGRLSALGRDGATSYGAAGAAFTGSSIDALAKAAEVSDTGYALFATVEEQVLVLPPFPLGGSRESGSIDIDPLMAAVEHRCEYAVFLLRLGGFSVGVFRDDALVASKTDQRFVKNRHKKGGQSQRRFERTREKQVHELFGKACETARETLKPYEATIEHVFLGGDRRTLASFTKECSYFERFGGRLRQRVVPVAGDPRHEVLARAPRDVRSSDVYVVRTGGQRVAGGSCGSYGSNTTA